MAVRVEAVRNKNSQKVFVLIDGSQFNKVTVLNPEGKVLTVPDGLFDSPFSVSPDKFGETFTREQIVALEKQARGKPTRSAGAAVKGSSARPSVKKKKVAPKFGVGAEWSASKLTFYKHKIDPLQETESFKINLEDHQTFEITKSDFCRFFNDVVIAASYWKEGAFTYNDLPEKAAKFIKAVC